MFLTSTPLNSWSKATGGDGGALVGAPPRSEDTISSMRRCANSMDSEVRPDMLTEPLLSIAMLVTPVSAMMPLIVSPPLPMMRPTTSGETVIFTVRGRLSGSVAACVGIASAMRPRMCSRPSLACSRARRISGKERPSHLMSSWNAVTPSVSPATLKSIVPNASSEPSMSVSTMGCPPPPSSSSNRPIATPATGRTIGTPAAIMARHPPHTDAIDDEPHDSVIRDSIRRQYGNSSSDGTAGSSARSAKLP
mmetsp:Transcript_46847/g.107605  ORF Transcript_46847/g.107605 Transcript_46847/m.107605 type:complete len:250 (-) Transcript_46847:410-1159(-)